MRINWGNCWSEILKPAFVIHGVFFASESFHHSNITAAYINVDRSQKALLR